MKFIKILLISYLLFLFFGNNVMASTEVIMDFSNNNPINKNITGVLPGTENSPTEHCRFKLSSDNKIAYCSDGHGKTPNGEVNAIWNNCQTLIGPKSISLAYIYENGYGSYKEGYSSSKYLVGDDKYTDYFITQAAVWRYTIEPQWLTTFISNNYIYNGTSSEVTNKIKSLIEDSQKAQEGPMLLIIDDQNMSLDLIGNYYVSKGIKLFGKYINSKITVNVEGPAGTFVTNNISDEKGTWSFENETTIYVKIPVSSVVDKESIAFSIIINANTALGEGRIQECIYSGNSQDRIQNMIIYNQEFEELTTKSVYSINTTTVKFSKQNVNSEYIKGAILTIKKGVSEIYTWTSTDEPQNISLLPGNYTLIEAKSPDGYIINEENLAFEVRNDGKIMINNNVVEEIIMVNNPIKITVSKRKIKHDKELPGAILRITDKNGNVAKDLEGNNLEWVTTEEPKTFHVLAGKYFVEEIKSPNGYELSHKKIEFNINEKGIVTIPEGTLIKKDKIVDNNIIVFENIPEPDNVPTGSEAIYIVIAIGLIAMGTTAFLLLKKSRNH